MKLATVLPLMIKAAEKLDLVIKKVEHEYAYYNVSVLVGDGSLNTLPRGTLSASALFDYLWDLVGEEVRQECLAADNKIATLEPAPKSKIKSGRKTLTLTTSPRLEIVIQLGLPNRAVFCAYAVDYKKNTYEITWNAFDNFDEILWCNGGSRDECCNWGVADKIIML